ncbi:MAG TPA: metallophosphoesterase family protein [bacterium]|nr:metallophosphoesterase family protein [bacterium]HPS28834.1 metallophosphoesterase family protein [bacterium]
MKILVISDTHGNLPIKIEELGVQAVIHAGDLGDRKFMKEFAMIENFFAVAGNTDISFDGIIPQTLCDIIGGVKFFLVHNLSAPHRIIMSNFREINECRPDLVVYGHTHMPVIEKKDGIFFINPGSLGKDGLTGHKTYAIVEIDKSKIVSAEIFDAISGDVLSSLKKNELLNNCLNKMEN